MAEKEMAINRPETHTMLTKCQAQELAAQLIKADVLEL